MCVYLGLGKNGSMCLCGLMGCVRVFEWLAMRSGNMCEEYLRGFSVCMEIVCKRLCGR